MIINLLLDFWFHPTGDILYHPNLMPKRSFFIFWHSYIFFRVEKVEMARRKVKDAGMVSCDGTAGINSEELASEEETGNPLQSPDSPS